MNLTYYMPTKIVHGRGAIHQSQADVAALGGCALILTGRASARRSGALQDVASLLSHCGIRYEIYDRISANPLLSSCEEAGQRARDIGAEFLVAIGGGSVLDASKAAALYAANKDIVGETIYQLSFANRALPIVAVGITAGTGSEVTPYAVLTVDRTGKKRSITHRDCYPAIAIADPAYTMSMDYATTVSTALDALSHAIEGWFSPRANAITDPMARQAIPLLWEGLCELTETERDKEIPLPLRERLHSGSLLAGLVLNHCSTGFPHPLGYPLTERFGIPHGKACAAFLPDLAIRGKQVSPERGQVLFALLGCTPEDFVLHTAVMAELPEITITDELIADCAARWEDCKNFRNSPGGFTREEALALFCSRFGNGR